MLGVWRFQNQTINKVINKVINRVINRVINKVSTRYQQQIKNIKNIRKKEKINKRERVSPTAAGGLIHFLISFQSDSDQLPIRS